MKKKIHPKMNEITVSCSCGEKHRFRSTKKDDYSVEICSACHPFYTGKQKVMDAAGRIEKFKAKFKNASYYSE
ncbi:MAG: 50S ribosomal protein L31 [bacterium]